MHISPEAARQHIDYNIWATRRLLEAAAPLDPDQLQRDFGTADRSVLGTLQHLLRSEHAWVNRLEENGQGPALPSIDTLPQLRETWAGVHLHWEQFVAGLSETNLERSLAYHDLKGNPRSNTVWEILLHVMNHSTHHRGQVSGFLRASGIAPPSVDYIAYVRLKKP